MINHEAKKEINNLLYNFKIDKKFWRYDNLTGEDYDKRRSKPAKYLETTIKIANILNLKTVVEIGSTRFSVTKGCVDYFDNSTDAYLSPPCCCDGHATYFWARAGFETHSVDISENCINGINWCYTNLNEEKPNNLHVHIPMDGIEFLKTCPFKIDILFLDGWDKGTPEYAEQHLEAFKSSKDKLSDTHLILIDDTDYLTEDGGKDKLLSPYLIENNYSMLFNGRQTLFINTII